ncbi:MAG TPA: sigma-70 family RNA polymerase sigma factor [Terracidiphilus sp.]|nr:sigma-70 family RNA polymerase sigma factor [Terracidiphilus sp.]
MAATLLHLVDQYGQPVPPQVRLAVEAAYRWAEREYRPFDHAVLAAMAEAVALAMCRHLDGIESPRRYAVAALMGKLHEWYRAHPAVEILMDPAEVEALPDDEPKSISAAELNLLFSEIKAQLSERDRQVLVLLEQDLGPQEIAKAFEISYFAAAKAIQRARDRMAAILSETRAQKGEENGTMNRPRAVGFKIW